MTKTGMAMTMRVSIRTTVSTGRPRRSPVTTPRLIPMTISKRIATMVSRMVTGKAADISSVTFCPLNAVPKSPVNTFPMYVRYCCHTGLSRPNSFLSWAAVAGSQALSPHRPAIGSPITFTIRKISSVAPKKTGIIWSRRRITYRPMRPSAGRRNSQRAGPGAELSTPGRAPYGISRP